MLCFEILCKKMFDCIWNLFSLPQEISSILLSMKEEKDLLDSVNLISAVANFEWLWNSFTFYYHLPIQRQFLVVVTIKTLKRASLKSINQKLCVASSSIKSTVKKKKKIHCETEVITREASSSCLLEVWWDLCRSHTSLVFNTIHNTLYFVFSYHNCIL